jgi:branched-chain amino acid transport system permease protein
MEITLRQVQDFFQVLTNGVAAGAVYALVAVSFILVYKAVGIVNFAAGEIVAVGGYVGVVLANILGLPLLIALPLCIVLMSFFGYGFQFVVYRPLKGKSFLIIAISTLATGIILANGIQLLFGPEPRRLEPLLANPTVDIKGVFISVPNLIIIFISVLTLIGIKLLFSKTRLGFQMMSTAQDPEMARLLGVNTDRMVSFTFMLSFAIAGLVGFLVAPVLYLVPTMGLGIALKGFAAAIIGGFGEVNGAIVGGLAIGILEILFARYLSSSFQSLLIFLVVLGFLYFRPEGIFNREIGQKV